MCDSVGFIRSCHWMGDSDLGRGGVMSDHIMTQLEWKLDSWQSTYQQRLCRPPLDNNPAPDHRRPTAKTLIQVENALYCRRLRINSTGEYLTMQPTQWNDRQNIAAHKTSSWRNWQMGNSANNKHVHDGSGVAWREFLFNEHNGMIGHWQCAWCHVDSAVVDK